MTQLIVKKIPCWECFGTGLVRQDNGFMSSQGPCPMCHGEGEYEQTERFPEQTLEQQINPQEQDKL